MDNMQIRRKDALKSTRVRCSGADHLTAHKLQCLRRQHLICRVDIGAIPCKEPNNVQMTV